MVLRLKTRESRSLPGLPSAGNNVEHSLFTKLSQACLPKRRFGLTPEAALLFGVVAGISTTQAIRVLAGYSYRHLGGQFESRDHRIHLETSRIRCIFDRVRLH